ncbi:MAG TPA: hypothetical protein VK926_05730 [Gaiellaceae bacterium]|nr:hypothetical protein [Gaiellaceae bacterium]
MERFNALGRGAQIMLVAGVLLLISTFFNWQSVDVGVVEVGQSAWNGFWGVVLGLLTVALVAWLVARLAGINIPLPFSAALIGGALAVLIFLFALIKILSDDFTSTWAWIGLALSVAIVAGAWLEIQASGGMDKLRSEMPSRRSSEERSETAPAASPPPPPPPAAAEPEPPAHEAAPEPEARSEREGPGTERQS